MALNTILEFFASDHIFLEIQGSLIVQKFCIILNAKSSYIRMAKVTSKYGNAISDGRGTA